MLAYHPALDPYHDALRLLQLLNSRGSDFELDALRILDFFLIFPEDIASVRLPKNAVAWRAITRTLANPYWFDGDRLLVFSQMKIIQDTALSLLSARGVVDRDALRQGRVRLLPDKVPADLRQLVETKNNVSSDLVGFLVGVLGELPVRGRDGLKDRSKLMEFRYDAP